MQRSAGTLKDIAEALNLSSGTVSRVLNGRGDLAQATRTKVFDLAAELNYAPRRQRVVPAAGLTRVALCIGNLCVGPDGTLDPSYVGFHFLTRIQQAAGERTVSVMVAFVNAADPALRLDALPMLQPGETQGLILAYPFPEASVRALADRMPVVSLEHVYPGASVDVVGPTHALDAMSAVQYLHRLGHCRIGYVGDECAQGHRLTSGLRHAGYVSGLARCGLTYRAEDVINVLGEPVQKDALPGVMAERVRAGVTAVITSIDRHGYLLWETLPALGVRVPQDLSIVGIGGVHRATGLPQLTTWRCAYERIASTALDLLTARQAARSGADLYQEIQSLFVPGRSAASPGLTFEAFGRSPEHV